MSMTNHPALQPRLASADVQELIGYLTAARDEARDQSADFRATADYMLANERACYAQGLDRAVEIVSDLWDLGADDDE